MRCHVPSADIAVALWPQAGLEPVVEASLVFVVVRFVVERDFAVGLVFAVQLVNRVSVAWPVAVAVVPLYVFVADFERFEPSANQV